MKDEEEISKSEELNLEKIDMSQTKSLNENTQEEQPKKLIRKSKKRVYDSDEDFQNSQSHKSPLKSESLQ